MKTKQYRATKKKERAAFRLLQPLLAFQTRPHLRHVVVRFWNASPASATSGTSTPSKTDAKPRQVLRVTSLAIGHEAEMVAEVRLLVGRQPTESRMPSSFDIRFLKTIGEERQKKEESREGSTKPRVLSSLPHHQLTCLKRGILPIIQVLAPCTWERSRRESKSPTYVTIGG